MHFNVFSTPVTWRGRGRREQRQRRRRPGMPLLPFLCVGEVMWMPKLAGYYYLSQKTQTPSCYFSILCPTLAGAYLAKLTLSFLGVNLVLESTYIGNHLTQVAPKSDMSFCSFAFGSQPFHWMENKDDGASQEKNNQKVVCNMSNLPSILVSIFSFLMLTTRSPLM